MFHVLFRCASVDLCMKGFQKKKKKKKIGKKLQDQQMLQKKLRFLFETCFSEKPFLVYETIIYFSRCHEQYFRRRFRFYCN